MDMQISSSDEEHDADDFEYDDYDSENEREQDGGLGLEHQPQLPRHQKKTFKNVRDKILKHTTPQRLQKYRAEWQQLPEFKGWLQKVPSDIYSAKCGICGLTLKATKTVLKNHSKSKLHLNNMSGVSISQKNKMESFFVKSAEAEKGQKSVEVAEVRLCGLLAEHNIPFKAMDHIVDVLKSCFPGSKILEKVSCKRTKAAAITKNVIGKSHKEALIEKLKRTKFSVMIDESTDVTSNKATCIVVRYYDSERSKIVSSFFDLVDLFQGDIDKATAKVIYEAVESAIKKCSIPIDNIVGFGSDGCNTMMGDNNSVKSRFEQSCKGIYVAKCLCHSCAICASEAAKMLPRRCEDLPRDIFSLFKNSAKRKAIFLKFQKLLDLDPHSILRPSQTRWLSLHQVVNRILEQWEALILFVGDINIEEKLSSADRVLQNLQDPQVKLFFLFLDWVLPKFNTLNAFFQSEKCIITTAHENICSVYKQLLSSFLESRYINSSNLSDIDPYLSSYQLHDNQIYLGSSVLEEVQSILNKHTNPQSEQKRRDLQMIAEFKERCRKFLQVACYQLGQRYDFSDKVLKTLYIFTPKNAIDCLTRTDFPSLLPLTKLLPRCKENEVETQKIDDEWRILVFYKLPEQILKQTEPDTFWGNLLDYKDENDEKPFYNLSKFVLNILCLPHANADCERLFSHLGLIKTKLRNCLNNQSVTNILLAKEHIKSCGDCTKFRPSSSMLKKLNKNMYDCKLGGEGDVMNNDDIVNSTQQGFL